MKSSVGHRVKVLPKDADILHSQRLLWGRVLDDLSERVGHRRGVSAGASVAAIVATADALRNDHAGENGRAALSGASGAAGRRGAQVV
jgi:hypothetical protein